MMQICEDDEVALVLMFRRAKQKVMKTRTVETFVVRVPRAGALQMYDIHHVSPAELVMVNGVDTRHHTPIE
jgi:hypothetical protein